MYSSFISIQVQAMLKSSDSVPLFFFYDVKICQLFMYLSSSLQSSLRLSL
uniref:Uncharacterized protein n=1 Tax=Kalanchoe fedtschenkoi TaxID=63787 RepID=A0A7N1A545_KALFE